MRPKLLVAVAGIPPEIGDEFVTGFNKTLPITSLLPLKRSEGYTNSYSKKLYERLACKLKEREQPHRTCLLSNTNLVLLYLHKNDGTESVLFDRFGAEALVVPMKSPSIADVDFSTPNQRGRAVNVLIREGRQMIGQARSLLAMIAEELTNRDNKTCLLLPRKNFGREIDEVFDCVRDVVLSGGDKKEFKRNLNRVSRLLRTVRTGKCTYFVGQGGLVFRSPGKAGARHGLAPVWEDPDHESSCVIRGRMRFGVSYDPKFHYDCDVTEGRDRCFPSCHGTKTLPRGRTHVNIAPNDNIR